MKRSDGAKGGRPPYMVFQHWTENTNDADLVLGCQVLADAAVMILRGEST
ncbi:hypothetical protein [Mesorhizobium temperatum]|nr:hypothetical protein [Mesorhizobium temperatum]